MQNPLSRLGPLPYLVVGIGLAALGLLALERLTGIWPFDPNQRLDLVRAVGAGQADAATLLDAALPELILTLLALVLATITGVMLPIVYFLNRRFRAGDPHVLVILRQAMWVGLWVTFCVWLQLNRTLGIAAALLIAAVLVLVEMMLQVRSRAAEERRALQVGP